MCVWVCGCRKKGEGREERGGKGNGKREDRVGVSERRREDLGVMCVEVPVMTILLSAKHHTCPSWYLVCVSCCGGRSRL